MALINPDTLNLEERVIQTNKVQKTHKGGRTMSWSILVVVGDGNGYVGAGIGKARAIPGCDPQRRRSSAQQPGPCADGRNDDPA